MATYRARSCPKCRYYVGYWLARPLSGFAEVAVKSFCLNCDYQFPVRALVRGKHRSMPRRNFAAGPAPLVSAAAPPKGARAHGQSGDNPRDPRAQRPNYARELRSIGQELEKRRFTRFNLKCSKDSYFVWSTENPTQHAPLTRLAHQSASARDLRPGGPFTVKAFVDRIAGVLFDTDDLKRLEREGIEARRRPTAGTHGRRLSHLLRTVGEEVYRRNQRLLAVSWQEQQIAVVAENAGGGREINVMRTDQLYDLWVRMYLRRQR